MAPITGTCGIINHELITLSGFGSFRVGWGDYTVKQNSSNVGIKVKNGSFINQVNPIVWSVDITMHDVNASLVTAFRTTQGSTIRSYINSGSGGLTVTLAGIQIADCIVKSLNVEQGYYTDDGEYRISQMSVTLESPVLNWI
jgi:hypothetical protein